MTALFTCNPHVGDRPLFRVQIVTCNPNTGLFEAKDVSAFTTLEIKVKPPDDPTITLAAGFTTDGSDGFIEARAGVGDLDVESPDWRVQGRVAGSPSEGPFSSKVERFTVEPNL